MSSNTVILEKILERLTGIETDIGTLKKQMSSVHSYMKTESAIQEASDVQKFIKALGEFQSMPTEVFPLKNLYRPDDSLLTDIDGCVIAGYSNKRAYIIESKHFLTTESLRLKLKQFCIIESMLKQIHNNEIHSVPDTKYHNMVNILKSFPQNIQLIFASDSMGEKMREYIININTGKININDSILVESFQESALYKDIFESLTVKNWAKNKLRKATLPKHVLILTENEASGLGEFKEFIREHFNSSDPCFSDLIGKIGIMHLGKVLWPELSSENIPGYGRGGSARRKTRRVRSLAHTEDLQPKYE